MAPPATPSARALASIPLPGEACRPRPLRSLNELRPAGSSSRCQTPWKPAAAANTAGPEETAAAPDRPAWITKPWEASPFRRVSTRTQRAALPAAASQLSISYGSTVTLSRAVMRRSDPSAAAEHVVEKVLLARAPWSKLPSGELILRGLTPDSDRLEPPWPDLIVSSGRRSALIARTARRRAGGKPLLVHVQDPRAGARDFDLVVAMAHDAVEGPNVLKVATTLHDVTPERLAAAADAWRERLAHLPRPLIGVVVGGPAGLPPRAVPVDHARVPVVLHHPDRR